MRNHRFIIAEAGVNHNGNAEFAKKLIIQAAEAGADAVKFQTFKPESLVSRYAQKAEYQKKNTTELESQLQMLKKLHLCEKDYFMLQNEADKCGIMFISAPFDLESIEFLESLNMPLYKIPSGEITNLPYLVKIAEIGKPVIMSTGMSNLQEIGEAIKVLKGNGASDI